MSMLKIYKPSEEKVTLALPLFSSTVEAGFPSPAEDYIEGHLDLNEYFVSNPPSTFYVKVSGQSMKNAGIFPGDILIIDRSITPVDKKIVIAIIDNELVVKRLRIFDSHIELHSENEDYQPLVIEQSQNLSIWGVVIGSVRKL